MGSGRPRSIPARAIAPATAVLVLLAACTGPEPVPRPGPASGGGAPPVGSRRPVDVAAAALSVLGAPEFAASLDVQGTVARGTDAVPVIGTGVLRPDGTRLTLSVGDGGRSGRREGLVVGRRAYVRGDGGPWVRTVAGPRGELADLGDVAATLRLHRLVGRVRRLAPAGMAEVDGHPVLRLVPPPGFRLRPSDLGLDSKARLSGHLEVRALEDGTPTAIGLEASWTPGPPRGHPAVRTLRLTFGLTGPAGPRPLTAPREAWAPLVDRGRGYRIAHPRGWRAEPCAVGGVPGGCLSRPDGLATLTVRRVRVPRGTTARRAAALEARALAGLAGLEAATTTRLQVDLRPAVLIDYRGWEAALQQVVTVRGRDAYSLTWMAGEPASQRGPGLARFLATFHALAARSPAPPASRAGPPLPELRSGAAGAAVLALQRRLTALRYDVAPVDGKFGYSTHHAVVAFEKVNGLSRDGVVDPATWRALYHPVVPTTRYRRAGSSIEVDLTRQVLYLVEDGRVARILDASTGGGYTFTVDGVRKVAVTVTGTYRIYLQIEGWYESRVGPMYRSNFFHRGFAIHGSGSVPPYPASHGCVRVTVPAMDRLWPSLYLGMPVSVYRS